MSVPEGASRQLLELAALLAARRAVILAAWRNEVDADPLLTTPPALPRRQFNDHVPDLLGAFELRLRSWPREFRGERPPQRGGHGRIEAGR